jgi:hypothetical protein
MSQLNRISRWVAALAAASAAAGCATYQGKVGEARMLIEHRRPAEAAEKLEPLANQEGDDQLVYMLDWATALQLAGQYKESASALNRGEKIADIQDYHSISNIAASLALSEEMVQYKGEDFEKVLINAVNSINYLMMGELDDALVEVRKVNQKLTRYRTEAKRNYEQNPFAYYLSATIWEASHKWDDAFIDYKSAAELVPDFPLIKEDLLRAAMRAQRSDEIAELRRKYPDLKPRPEWKDPGMGELVFIMQQGWGPRKQPRPGAPRFPKLFPTHSMTQAASLVVNGQAVARTERIYSVQDVAIKTLDDAYAELVAKRVAGVATKAVIADQIRQKNELLGAVAWVALNVADRADLRQWSTLPETFQVARVFLKAGTYNVGASGLFSSGAPDGERMPEQAIKVLPGKKTFVTWRSLN